MMKVISAIVALAKALPVLDSWLEKLLSAWATARVAQMEGPYQELSKQRRVLMKSIARSETDEERLINSVLLHKLNSGQLSQ